MEYAVICTVAAIASLLTFFTGFGLGTMLLPAFAAFFAAETAVALTAVVHLLNSLFKLLLVGRQANLRIAVLFGLPAIAAAACGAAVLVWLANLAPLAEYEFAGGAARVTPVAVVVAALMLLFATLELWPRFKRLSIPSAFLPAGGVLAGFFGGLSGHQGALRSAFLVRSGLEKGECIATGVVIAAVVDLARIAVYARNFFALELRANGALLAAAAGAALLGSIAGNRLLEKVSLRAIEVAVAIALAVVAAGLGSGLL